VFDFERLRSYDGFKLDDKVNIIGEKKSGKSNKQSHYLINVTYKFKCMKLPIGLFNLHWPLIKEVFENPTLNHNAPRRSVLNSARWCCFLQYPLAVREVREAYKLPQEFYARFTEVRLRKITTSIALQSMRI
jgi:hypothetical protein